MIHHAASPILRYRLIRKKYPRVHFIGLGGIGMSGLAEVMLQAGFEVSGSDLSAAPVLGRLARLGARVCQGHDAGNLGTADLVVRSSAIGEDNPELAAARQAGGPVVSRGELLGGFSRLHHTISVTGSHGKTTTTGMIAQLLLEANLDPSVFLGGTLPVLGGNARLGAGDYLVAEADESDGSFLYQQPDLAIVTNVDAEHLDYYRHLDNLTTALAEFLQRLPFYGVAVICLDDPHLRRLLPGLRGRTRTYGFSPDAELRAEEPTPAGEGMLFDVRHQKRRYGSFRIAVPGRHNVQHAPAAIAVGLELGLSQEVIRRSLAAFQGVDRRLQTRGIVREIRVEDDYGHHPTEIAATLAAARLLAPGRLIAIFQPHRFSRAKALWAEFATAFSGADELYCTPIYPAGEKPLAGVSGEALSEAIRAASRIPVHFAADFDALAAAVARLAQPGDLVITRGAGAIREAADRILANLAREQQA